MYVLLFVDNNDAEKVEEEDTKVTLLNYCWKVKKTVFLLSPLLLIKVKLVILNLMRF